MNEIEWLYNGTTYPFNYATIIEKIEKIEDDVLSDVLNFIKDNRDKIIVGLKDDAQTIFTVKKHESDDWHLIVLNRNVLKKGVVYAESLFIYYIAKLMGYTKFTEINDKIFKSKIKCDNVIEQIHTIHEYAKNMEETNYIPRLVQSIYLNKYGKKMLRADEILNFVYDNNKKENFTELYNEMLRIPTSADKMYSIKKDVESKKENDVNDVVDDPEVKIDPKEVIRTVFEKYKNKYIQKGTIYYINKCYEIT